MCTMSMQMPSSTSWFKQCANSNLCSCVDQSVHRWFDCLWWSISHQGNAPKAIQFDFRQRRRQKESMGTWDHLVKVSKPENEVQMCFLLTLVASRCWCFAVGLGSILLPSSLTATSTRDTSDKTSNHRCNTTCTYSKDRMLTCTPARSALRKNGCTNCVLANHSCALVHTRAYS